MTTPPNDSPLVTVGLNLTRSMRYLHDNQGVSKADLVWVLHGILGQVLSWDDLSEMNGDKDDFPNDGRSFNPDDLIDS